MIKNYFSLHFKFTKFKQSNFKIGLYFKNINIIYLKMLKGLKIFFFNLNGCGGDDSGDATSGDATPPGPANDDNNTNKKGSDNDNTNGSDNNDSEPNSCAVSGNRCYKKSDCCKGLECVGLGTGEVGYCVLIRSKAIRPSPIICKWS